jgi:hypothetical protein
MKFSKMPKLFVPPVSLLLTADLNNSVLLKS